MPDWLSFLRKRDRAAIVRPFLRVRHDWEQPDHRQARALTPELARRLHPAHPLHGQSPVALAQACASDDVLFQCADGRLCLVHLEWQDSSDPALPDTHFFDGIDQLLAALDTGDGERVPPCPSGSADWQSGEASRDCPCCGGFALDRPCPKCGGACGAQWQRAVQDSIDGGIAVWIGKCGNAGS